MLKKLQAILDSSSLLPTLIPLIDLLFLYESRSKVTEKEVLEVLKQKGVIKGHRLLLDSTVFAANIT